MKYIIFLPICWAASRTVWAPGAPQPLLRGVSVIISLPAAEYRGREHQLEKLHFASLIYEHQAIQPMQTARKQQTAVTSLEFVLKIWSFPFPGRSLVCVREVSFYLCCLLEVKQDKDWEEKQRGAILLRLAYNLFLTTPARCQAYDQPVNKPSSIAVICMV